MQTAKINEKLIKLQTVSRSNYKSKQSNCYINLLVKAFLKVAINVKRHYTKRQFKSTLQERTENLEQS